MNECNILYEFDNGRKLQCKIIDGLEFRYNAMYRIWIDQNGVIYNELLQELKPWLGTSNLNTKYYCLQLNGKRCYVHRLIAYCWCKGYQKGLVCDHIDGNRLNNHPSNLQWITQSENIKKSFKK